MPTKGFSFKKSCRVEELGEIIIKKSLGRGRGFKVVKRIPLYELEDSKYLKEIIDIALGIINRAWQLGLYKDLIYEFNPLRDYIEELEAKIEELEEKLHTIENEEDIYAQYDEIIDLEEYGELDEEDLETMERYDELTDLEEYGEVTEEDLEVMEHYDELTEED